MNILKSKKFIRIWLIAVILSLSYFANQVQAIDKKISVIYQPSTFSKIENAEPGKDYTRQFSVLNNSSENQKLGMKVNNLLGNLDFAKKINLIIKNNQNQELLKQNIKAANESIQEFYLADVGPNSKTDYKIISKMSENTSNQYQNNKITYDIQFGFIAPDGFQAQSSNEVINNISNKARNLIANLKNDQEEKNDTNNQSNKTENKEVSGVSTNENVTKNSSFFDKYWYFFLILLIIFLFLLWWFLIFKRRRDQNQEEKKSK